MIDGTFSGGLPAAPADLVHPPTARLQISPDSQGSPYAPGLRAYLLSLFKQAGRPLLTEADNADFVILASITVPPELNHTRTQGGKFSLGQTVKSLGGLFGAKPSDRVTTNLDKVDLEGTNVLFEIRSGVALELLDSKKAFVEQSTVKLTTTNTLKALGAGISGVTLGNSNPDDVGKFKTLVTTEGAKQDLVELSAYEAAKRLLVLADPHFLKFAQARAAAPPPPVAVTPAKPADGPAPDQKVVHRAKFCSECGASLAPTAKFCSGCGAKVVD